MPLVTQIVPSVGGFVKKLMFNKLALKMACLVKNRCFKVSSCTNSKGLAEDD